MRRGILGIFDYELDYARNLMEYLNRKEGFGFEVCMFTNLNSLLAFHQKRRLDILLVGEDIVTSELSGMHIQNIFVLSEGFQVQENSQYPSVYKFQSTEALIKEVMTYYVESEGESPNSRMVINPGKVEFLGVISPKGGSGKTIFSMALGEACGKSGKVLYLGFEPISSCLGEEGAGTDMSDLIYFLKQKRKGLVLLIQSLGRKLGGIHCITNVSHFKDLQALNTDDIDFLMDELGKSGIYDKIIFDIGYLDSVAFHILERCNSVYVTQLRKDIFTDKSEAFGRMLQYEEKEYLNDRFINVDLPRDTMISSGSYAPGNLLEGELGQFVWGLLKGHG